MSRFVEDITTTKSAEEVEQAVSRFLTGEGFSRVTYRQNQVWKKGYGLILNPQYITATPVDGHVHLEAWIKHPIFPGLYVGESGTEGKFYANVPKRRLKKRVERIEELLRPSET